MEKLPKVEYDLDLGLSTDVSILQETAYTKESRPMESIDAIFERKMSKRLTKFHAKPIDRT